MDFTFERGSADNPKGHALLYFDDSMNPGELLATYMVTLPIQVDVSKYVPPFLMNQLGDVDDHELSAFAFPPAPEPVESMDFLEKLARAREDDLIYGGSVSATDPLGILGTVNDAIGWYSELCFGKAPQPAMMLEDEIADDDDDLGLSVNDVLYGLMSDQDKLSELTRLVGRLRDAVSSGDNSLAAETRADILTLGRHLPDNHEVPRLAEAASSVSDNAGQLASLYLQRCFYLMAEEYVKLGEVEDEIRGIVGEF